MANQYVKVSFGAHWHLGTLVELGERGARLSGIRSAEKKEGQLLLVNRMGVEENSSPLAIRTLSFDAEGGTLLVEFLDPAAVESLRDYLRTRGHTGQHPRVKPA